MGEIIGIPIYLPRPGAAEETTPPGVTYVAGVVETLHVCAHQLWTGDLIEEGVSILTLKVVNATWGNGDEGQGILARLGTITKGRFVENRWHQIWRKCERLHVIRGAETPGGYLNQMDTQGRMHGWGPALPRPCSCTWHDRAPVGSTT